MEIEEAIKKINVMTNKERALQALRYADKVVESDASKLSPSAIYGSVLCSHIETIRNALTQSGWQPIATMPKISGRWVLGWGAPMAHAFLIEYSGRYGFTDYRGHLADGVTHWMPLPEPPEEDK